uniref:RanBP2-type domain-containing protein n=1 Tax=Phytophthora ramorum TaxID=164328 RepID=H3GJM7_PHYRM
MTELATEHVRMLDAGRLRVAHESPLTTSFFAPVASRKTQLLQHGNAFGLSFVATEKGFVMTNNDELEASCADYTKRRQEAMDHGQKLTLEEIHAVPATKEVQLPSISYWIALSPDELMVAVAYGESVSLFEVAHIVEATAPAPFHTFSKLQAQEIAWCTNTTSERLAVLTVEKQVFVCTLAGGKEVIETQIDASSVSWSPSGEQIAVGLVDGTIGVYGRDTLQILRSIGQPECCSDEGLEVHHVNWAEENLILVGYQKYDEGMEETTALACIYENDEFVELDEVVGFFDVENRRHQYFSVFLSDWRMFFIGCSLSADIELLVSDPDGGDWALWKPLEKYQARLPMNANDEESFPTGLALNLNSTSPVPVDEDAFPPVPIVSCTNTEGLLVNFGFVDTTVHDVLEFVKSPVSFEKKVTRVAAVKEEPKEASDSPPGSPTGNPAEAKTKMAAAAKQAISHEYGQNDENEFAESDGESSDEEEERKEEEEKARNAFRSVASDGSDFIVSELFPNLFKTLGATYDEEEHASTLERLEKDGKVYEADFIPWYVNWIFGDDESDSDEDDVPSASVVEPTEMKSKEEIAAAFSKFTAKEGSWKCAVCMVNNNPDAVKCSACETPNPAAPKPSSSNKTISHEYGQNDENEFAESDGEDSDEEVERKEEEDKARNAFRSIMPDGSEFITSDQFPKLFKTLGATYDEEGHATTLKRLERNGKVYEIDFISWYIDWIFGGDLSDSENENDPVPAQKAISHEYGQNDENEFAESDGESSDEEEERKEEEEKARNAFRSVASDGSDFIVSELFPNLFKTLGATYDEEEHASTLERLEKDGKVYEADFIPCVGGGTH